jgi:hypothetical protein
MDVIRRKLAQAVTFVSCTRKVPDSDCGDDTEYPGCFLHGFSQYLHDKSGVVPQLDHTASF